MFRVFEQRVPGVPGVRNIIYIYIYIYVYIYIYIYVYIYIYMYINYICKMVDAITYTGNAPQAAWSALLPCALK